MLGRRDARSICIEAVDREIEETAGKSSQFLNSLKLEFETSPLGVESPGFELKGDC